MNLSRGIGASWISGLAVLALLCLPAMPATANDATPVISIIIDDMGYRLEQGRRALALPGPLSYSFLPFTPNGARLAETAHALGKEILLHLPMEAEHHNHLLGPGALRSDMDQVEIATRLRMALESVPRAIGVNNHMGSLLTTQADRMQWLMTAIHRHRGLFFIDSRTTSGTVAEEIALEQGIPSISRDVFLDDDLSPTAIAMQFHRLLDKAREQGYALAIAHPHPQTLALLAAELPDIEQRHGVRLIRLGRLVKLEERHPSWQLSLSPSPTAAKN